ncbi:MAG TPA: nickel pincer cofactor biosynthesis protein LarC, partial [Clostridiales bacterium UBA8960]|nr:nickel pincer cofactor biosynthesis protein LarC [Clostridiales bacterium UBA8960]
MKILYYDCFAGLSGDMNLGAMIDLGVDLEQLKAELAKLGLDHEFKLTARKDEKHGIFGTKVDVVDFNHDHDHHHDHHHDHEHDHEHAHGHASLRDFSDIRELILKSDLSERVKNDSIKMFEIIAEAEAKIHGKKIEEVHFHEVGAIDSIIDVIGTAICMDILEVDRVMSSTVELGSGFVKCAHGLMPIPAPATAEILKGIPIKSTIEKNEMTTPTGAAILKAYVSEFTDDKRFMIKNIGYGLGSRNLKIPNLVRVMIVEMEDGIGASDENKQWIMETNIDDMSSEHLVYAEERLLAAGALDVYKTPIIMKKGRPAIKLSVLSQSEDLKKLQHII